MGGSQRKETGGGAAELVAQIQEQRARLDRAATGVSFSEAPGSVSSLGFQSEPQDRQQAEASSLGWAATVTAVDAPGKVAGRQNNHQHDSLLNVEAQKSHLAGLGWQFTSESPPDMPSYLDNKKDGASLPSLSVFRGRPWEESHDFGRQEQPGQGMSHSVVDPASGALPSGKPSDQQQITEGWPSIQQTDTGPGPELPQVPSPPVWKPAPVPKPKSLMEIQHEEAERRLADEKAAADAAARAVSLGSSGSSANFGPWASSSAVSHPKSLREIQEEEARRAAAQGQSAPATFSSSIASSGKSDSGHWPLTSQPSGGDKVNLREVLAEEALVRAASKKNLEVPTVLPATPVSVSVPVVAQPQAAVSSAFDDSDFVEPKESKKNKKRASKAKGAVSKTTPTSTPEPVQISPSASSKTLDARLAPHDSSKDVLPSPPPGPSLADYLQLKEEVSSPQPLPAWSMDPTKQAKSAKSLKEIQEVERRAREEQDRQFRAAEAVQASSAPVKPVIVARTTSGSGASAWQRPSVPPPPQSSSTVPSNSFAVPPVGPPQLVPANSSARPKTGVFEDDDDLFWDYGEEVIGAVKQSTKSER